MKPEKWQQVEQIFHAALELAPDERGAYLTQVCADDAALRREVESLLGHDAQAADFIEQPAVGFTDQDLAEEQSIMQLGQHISHYQILARLGKGGMGEVYQARDTRLDRTVALKILPAEVANDAERMRRFTREAKAASAMNHPHVATIYEIGEASTAMGGIQYIAMEYVAGQTLATKIHGQPLPLDELVTVGSQIADALDEAHRKGITHRDIKPANLMLTARGQVKVLDFGLAKIACPLSLESNASTLQQTMPGIVMGTVPYMSPEQALGRDVDHRSDIFSLGVVLYEMATGRLPFVGANTVETLDRILHAEPEAITQLNTNAPIELKHIVQKCLEKERTARYQSAAEVLAALQSVPTGVRQQTERAAATQEIESVTTGGTAAAKMRSLLRRSSVLAALAVGLLLALGAYLFWRRSPEPPPSANARPVNSVAYEEYLRGRYYTNRQNAADNETAIRTLERAVAADPNFAAAQAELAQAYIWKLFLFTPKEKALEEKAFMAMEKALALDPNLGAAYLARGRLLWTPAQRFPHAQAIQEYRRALTLDPSLDEARNQIALVYNHIGALEPALRELQQAVAHNPTNHLAQYHLGQTLLFQRKYEEAYNTLRRIPREANPAKLTYHTAMALLHLDRKHEAAALAEEFLKDHPDDVEGGLMTSLQAILAALSGDEQQAEAQIQRSIKEGKGFGHFHHTAYSLACAYALLKKPDSALQWLQAAADDGFPCYALFESEPFLDSLKTDPRFVALLTKLKEQWEQYR
jgi:eukaryotic-like serine/threonine-protein kinase